ncbi:MAG: Fe-S cluster assembly ATPase SufC [Oscillospiraceae bacterium]|nr:Fe-S cluster assembly ATPase SufC [Oscillospiraceae bacterium]
MAETLLKVSSLDVRAGEKNILHGVDLSIKDGETHVLMGPNGAGKSTLGFALMGSPRYEITSGSITFDGEDVTSESADKRARAGMFLSFQEPLEVPGLSLESFLRSVIVQRTGKAVRRKEFKQKLEDSMNLLQIDRSYASRDLNVGFSGGEKKKIEILQMLMLEPKLAILDETDSGLDVDAVRLVSDGIRAYQEQKKGALLVITHSTRILDSLHVDRTHVMVDGRIAAEGDASVVERINAGGYEQFQSPASGEVCREIPTDRSPANNKSERITEYGGERKNEG